MENRKKIIGITFWLVLSILLTNKVNAQIIKGEVMAGLNMTQVDGDEVYGFKKPGLNLGAGAMIPFAKNWDLSIETNYSQKGAKQKVQNPEDTLNGAYRIYLNYLEVPVLVHYTDKELMSIGTGFSWGRLVGASEYEHDKQTATTAQNNVYKPDDFCVLIDLRLKIYEALKFNFRYSYSMAKIRTRDFTSQNGIVTTRHQYNNVLTFRLLYMFNETRSKRILNQE